MHGPFYVTVVGVVGVVGVGSDAVFSLLCIMMKPLCCGIAELQSFASGIEKDKDAVRAGRALVNQ